MIETPSFRFDLLRQMVGVPLFVCYVTASDGLAADAVAPPEGSVLEASEESQAIYNAAVQEVTVLQRSYWSSNLSGAQSELVMPGPHGSCALPQIVRELKRILRLNLAAASAARRATSGTRSERVSRLSDVSAN